MRTGARGSPSWPERMLRGRIHCGRLSETSSHKKPLADRGRTIHSERTGAPNGLGPGFGPALTLRPSPDVSARFAPANPTQRIWYYAGLSDRFIVRPLVDRD